MIDLLYTVGFGVLGLVSVLFSLLFLVVQWASTTFSPRLGTFRSDPLIWRTFALTIGLFVYSVTAAIAIDAEARVSAVVPAAGLLVVLVVLTLMRTLQVRAFRSLELAPTLSTLVDQGLDIIARAYPAPYTGPSTSAPCRPGGSVIAWRGPPGVLQQLDLSELIAEAARGDADVEFVASIGEALWPGKTLAVRHRAAVDDGVIDRAVVLGLERTFEQDPMLAFRLLADIAMRALSSAINDPATAVQVLDSIETLLHDAVTRELGPIELSDTSGRGSVTVNLPTWADLLSTSVDDLITVASGSPMVLSRLADLFDRLGANAPSDRADAITTRLRHVRMQLAQVDPIHANASR